MQPTIEESEPCPNVTELQKDDDTQQKKKEKWKDLVRRRNNKENKGKKNPRLIVEAKLNGDATSQCPSKPHPSTPCSQNRAILSVQQC